MKVTIKKENFIDWYFSDSDEIYRIGRRIVNQLKNETNVGITIEELLHECCELPSYIMEEYKDDENSWTETLYFVPSEIKLID